MKTFSQIVFRLLILIGLLFISCEFLIYFPVLLRCTWPEIAAEEIPVSPPLRVIFLADPHLLGRRLGHWFDKLRREWQMQRSFQTAVSVFHPDVVFILGDLTDEGKWEDEQEFYSTMERFQRIFSVPDHTQLHVIVGNHDVGFHDFIQKSRLLRFHQYFDLQDVKLISIQDIVFVLVNSMAFHGDGCAMCSQASRQLRRVSEQLNCTRYGTATGEPMAPGTDKCKKYEKLPDTKPILLQHFPLFRESEAGCDGPDSPSPEDKQKKHRLRLDVLSEEASNMQLSLIQPRMVLSGHTHHGCYRVHPQGTPEITVPSFSWRNRNNPSFILVSITKEDFLWEKCFLPEESTVFRIYILGAFLITCWLSREMYRRYLTEHHDHQASDSYRASKTA